MWIRFECLLTGVDSLFDPMRIPIIPGKHMSVCFTEGAVCSGKLWVKGKCILEHLNRQRVVLPPPPEDEFLPAQVKVIGSQVVGGSLCQQLLLRFGEGHLQCLGDPLRNFVLELE